MEFRDTPEEAEFRTEVRGFINSALPSNLKNVSAFEEPDDPAQLQALRDWRTAVGKKGWTAPHWPKEYGGAGMSVTEQFVYSEEMANARAPQVGGSGVAMLGPVLIRYGTEEQQKEHLPRITSGEVQWCQGYSEPGSGSDLASLQTRAIRDGDDFVINGQKIWTSGAHRADWMFLLARTDPNAPKHRGISMLLMDMKSPGISVQPLITMGGDHVFNQEFFDNVRVPAKNIVGEENRGWYVGAALLDFERSNIAGAIGHKHFVNDIVALAKSAPAGFGPLASPEARPQRTRRPRSRSGNRPPHLLPADHHPEAGRRPELRSIDEQELRRRTRPTYRHHRHAPARDDGQLEPRLTEGAHERPHQPRLPHHRRQHDCGWDERSEPQRNRDARPRFAKELITHGHGQRSAQPVPGFAAARANRRG